MLNIGKINLSKLNKKNKMLCPEAPAEPQNDRIRSLVSTLRIIAIFQLFLGITKVFLQDVVNGVFDILAALVLWQGYTRLNLCTIAIYMVMNILSLFFYAIPAISVYLNILPKIPGTETILAVVYYLSLVFYPITLWYSYSAYRELSHTYEESRIQLVPKENLQNNGPSNIHLTKSPSKFALASAEVVGKDAQEQQTEKAVDFSKVSNRSTLSPIKTPGTQDPKKDFKPFTGKGIVLG